MATAQGHRPRETLNVIFQEIPETLPTSRQRRDVVAGEPLEGIHEGQEVVNVPAMGDRALQLRATIDVPPRRHRASHAPEHGAEMGAESLSEAPALSAWKCVANLIGLSNDRED